MLIDARSLPAGEEVESDVCVVGAGPAGLTLAMQLAEAGVRVSVVEAGGLEKTKSSVRLASAESVGSTYYAVRTTRVKVFGGTSDHWGKMRARPLDEIDFERRPGVPHSGWPFERSHLEPYYERAHPICELGPYTYDVKEWTEAGAPEPLPVGGRATTFMFQLAETEGFRRHLSTVTSTDKIQVLLHSHAAELLTEPGADKVIGLRVLVDGGRGYTVAARHYVLAAGGLENPRLLLMSTEHTPAGLGNGNDLVGRYFAEHLRLRTGQFEPTDPSYVHRSTIYDVNKVDGVTLQANLGVSEDVLREEELLNSTFFLEPHARVRGTEGARSLQVLIEAATGARPLPPRIGAHLRAITYQLPDVARAGVRRLRGTLDHEPQALLLLAMGEQAPNPDSRVTLSTRRDQMGMPKLRLDWRLTDLDRRSILRAQDIVDEELRRAGVGGISHKAGAERFVEAMVRGFWHHIGTTRMHEDPRQGVTDADGRVHGVSNLYVAGSSLFPTGGYANPTLTIVALALRLADHLRDRLASHDA
ncbi:MAG: FAD-dependent oxidoreductase [Solirubrobacterales bacterium]